MYYVGIDVGGTSVKLGLFDEQGTLVARHAFPTKDIDEVAKDTVTAVYEIFEKVNLPIQKLKAIGIGFPGHVDGQKGIIVYSNNLEAHNYPFVDKIKEKLDVKIRISNDANVAALGEYHFGKGKELQNIVFVTLGTGVGGGIIIDGKMLEGKNGAGAEIGHMVISTNGQLCTCGRKGCFETYASANALLRNARVAMNNNPGSALWQVVDDPNKLDGTAFFKALETKDHVAEVVFEQYIDDLAEGLTNLANIFRPDAIILGGGISYSGDVLMKPLQERLAKMIYGGQWNAKVELMISDLRNDAGIYGAFAMAKYDK